MLLFQSQAVQLGSVTIEAAIAILILAVLFRCTKPELLTVMHAQLFAVELFFNTYLILQYMAPAFVTMLPGKEFIWCTREAFLQGTSSPGFPGAGFPGACGQQKGKKLSLLSTFLLRLRSPSLILWFSKHTCPTPPAPSHLPPCCRFCSQHLPYPG